MMKPMFGKGKIEKAAEGPPMKAMKNGGMKGADAPAGAMKNRAKKATPMPFKSDRGDFKMK